MATPEITFVDDAQAPEFFADLAGVFTFEGASRLTFISRRANHGKENAFSNVVVARVAMTSQMARALAKAILDNLEAAAKNPVILQPTESSMPH